MVSSIILAIADTQDSVKVDVSEFNVTIINVLIPAIVSIIGFVATYLSLSKSFKDELIKQKTSVHIEKMSTVPYDVLTLMDDMINSGKVSQQKQEKMQVSNLESFNNILNTIYSYGSEKAIQLVSLMQKELYFANNDMSKLDQYRFMSFYVLLATQIKCDITGISVSPGLWFQMRITDFNNKKK